MPTLEPKEPVADGGDEDKQSHLEGGPLTDADNRVGYCRPPKHTRFQPGQSGNLGGRPIGVKSLPNIVRKIVGQKITVTENGRTRRIPRLEAIRRERGVSRRRSLPSPAASAGGALRRERPDWR